MRSVGLAGYRAGAEVIFGMGRGGRSRSLLVLYLPETTRGTAPTSVGTKYQPTHSRTQGQVARLCIPISLRGKTNCCCMRIECIFQNRTGARVPQKWPHAAQILHSGLRRLSLGGSQERTTWSDRGHRIIVIAMEGFKEGREVRQPPVDSMEKRRMSLAIPSMWYIRGKTHCVGSSEEEHRVVVEHDSLQRQLLELRFSYTSVIMIRLH